MAQLARSSFSIPIKTLLDQFTLFMRHRIDLHSINIGEFPNLRGIRLRHLPKLHTRSFQFVKWLYRAPRSDLALVAQPDGSRAILKMYKLQSCFAQEKGAYTHLRHFNVHATGAVVNCYGWTEVTPASFEPCPMPTCYGDETDNEKVVVTRKTKVDDALPRRINGNEQQATYSWANPNDKRLRDYGADFRPPTSQKSWNWIMGTTPFASDMSDVPDKKDLPYQRSALLLEYLPDARRAEEIVLTMRLATQALSGLQEIQKALVEHGDCGRQLGRNLLVTSDDRAVWIDFDRAVIYDHLDESGVMSMRNRLFDTYQLLFRSNDLVDREGSSLIE